MRHVPVPGAFHDRLDQLELGFPAEFAAGALASCDQSGGIAGPPRIFHHGNFAAAHFAATLDHFADAGAAAGAEVELRAFSAIEIFHREHVGLGEIDDVNVVAD